MMISRFVAVPAFATLSLVLSFALLPIQADAPHASTAASVSAANPA